MNDLIVTSYRCSLRLIAVLGAAAVVLGIGPAPALAHAELVSSDPSDGETVTSAPTSLELVFNAPIAPDLSTITLRPSAGGDTTTVATRGEGPRLIASTAVALTDTPERSSWTVVNRVVSDDGHPITGRLEFAVEPPATSAGDETLSPPDRSTRDDGDDTGGQAVSTLVIGLITLVGTVGTVYLIARGRTRKD